ncbi:hypothetical protein [Paenibacillus rhizophilus]|uniref:Uncharacterized protein n=1 Tax=Paenibacillus rhizophilus TaxID=1850366 RepID=A0A3N9P4S2_9BACL|nr:hypothetical protein [Paenibacillus rhizophilus]RQW10400.1 hypothetical protein EH198_16420 [Paenibacillus rhizophilus]
MTHNYEKMWRELQKKLQDRADDDDFLTMADVADVVEELENEWMIVTRPITERIIGRRASNRPQY